MDMATATYTRQRGITLIEMVVTIVILAIALVGISAAISGGMSRNANVMLETRAVALAQAYLDEILSKRFDEASNPRGIPPCRTAGDACADPLDLGPDATELSCSTPRACFNDVDDYHGLDEGYGQSDPLQDAEGNERGGYENFRVRVSVRYLQPGAGGEEEDLGVTIDDLSREEDAKLITVTVSHRSNSTGWHFSVYKANF